MPKEEAIEVVITSYSIHYTKLYDVLENIVSILKEEGFVKNYRVLPDPKQSVLRIYLRSEPDSGYAIKGIRRVSRSYNFV